MDETKPETQKQRTDRQRNAIEVYCREVAKALDSEGHTLQDIVKHIRRAEIRPTQANIKAVVWNGVSDALLSKTSSTQLETNEVDKVYEIVNKWLGQEFQIHIPFPSVDSEKIDATS